MINLIYISSNGKKYNLLADKMRLTGGMFHDYSWNPDSKQTVYGDRVYGFGKESKVYDLVLTLRGAMQERLAKLNELTNTFENDVIKMSPGKIYFGEYYIECYITKSQTAPSELSPRWTQMALSVYCPYPFWKKEKKKQFYCDDGSSSEEYGFLDYPYLYAYDYSRPKSGLREWNVDHSSSSNFEMVIYGPCANPRILVNEYVYQIYDTLDNGEYIIVNSQNRTIKKYLLNGTVKNMFDSRAKSGNSVFQKIPSGNLSISWNGDFGFDITLFMERSEPEWI